MKDKINIPVTLIVLVIFGINTLLHQSKATEQQQNGIIVYSLEKHVLASGGGRMTNSSAGIEVISVIGQIDVAVSGNGVYQISGGFLTPAIMSQSELIFKNSFE